MIESRTETHRRTETLRKEILAEAAARWNAMGLRYSVVHGAEQYPTRMGRDIDVMTDAASEEAVIATTLSVFRANGWAVTAHRMTIGVSRIIGHRTEDGTVHAAEIDVASNSLRWGPIAFLDAPSAEAGCARRGPFIVDLWGSFVKRILIQALSGNVQRIGRRPAELELSDREAAIARRRLAAFANAELASDFVDAVQAKDLDRLRTCSHALRVALLRESLRGHRLAATMHGVLTWVKNKLALNVFMKKAAPVVALVGPPGIDKDAIIEAMHQSMRHELAFPDMVVRRWPFDPAWAPDATDGVSAAGAGVALPSQTSAWRHGARFVRHALSYLSTHLQDRERSTRLYLVVYDQWLLDALARAAHGGSFLERGMHTLLRLIPRPDLVILLHGDATDSRAQSAKPSTEALENQKAWHTLAEQDYIDVTLEVDAPPAEMARRVIRAVVHTFNEMHEGDELH